VRPEVEAFFRELHARHLRPMGFRKIRHRFWRGREGYVEHFVFDGSQWNSSDGPWRFHLDVGIELPDFPTRTPGWGPANARGRVSHVVSDAPDHFDLSPATSPALLLALPSLIERASAGLGNLLPRAREWARTGRNADIHSLRSGLCPPHPGSSPDRMT
jgi:hypothetical protein